MSDVPQGPGWWQASDGRWYSPAQRPGAVVPPPPADDGPPPGHVPPPGDAPPPGYGPPPAYGPPPGYPAPPGYVPPPPSSSSGSNVLLWVLVAIGVVVVLVMGSCVALVVAVGSAADEVGRSLEAEQADEADDVSEPRCGTDAAGFLTAEADVTNSSSERSNYTIELAFESPDGDQVDTSFAFVSALDPGQSTVVDVQSLTESPGPGVTCRVVDVERYSDEP